MFAPAFPRVKAPVPQSPRTVAPDHPAYWHEKIEEEKNRGRDIESGRSNVGRPITAPQLLAVLGPCLDRAAKKNQTNLEILNLAIENKLRACFTTSVIGR
jgi:hypothetical protein